MIADAAGVQPNGLKLEADQRFFHDHLRAADVLVHGRNSGAGGSARRRRIIVTRRVPDGARGPANPRAVLWNPGGCPFGAAWALTGVGTGSAAIIGGTDVFGLFLEWGYEVFHLSRADGLRLP